MSEEKKQEYIAENAHAEADTIFGGTPSSVPKKKKSAGSKNKQMLIAGICAVVVLGGGLAASVYVLGQNQPPEENIESSEAEAIVLNTLNADDLLSADITNTEHFTVTRALDESGTAIYSIEGFEDMTMDGGLLSTVISNGSKLEAASLVEEQASDLGKYGLAEPAASVVLHYAGGSEFVFTVGDLSPMSSAQTYVAVDGNIYLVRNSLVANYKKSFDQFVSLTLLEEPEQSAYPIVESVRIERQDIDYDICIEYDHEGADDDSVGGTLATHVMREPVSAYLDVEKSVPVTNGMFGLTATEIPVIRPEESDLKKTGLDDPFCTVTMVCDDGSTYTLLLGDTYETEKGELCYYAQFEDVPLIYGIAQENAAWATIQPGDITSANIFTSMVWNIATLEVTVGDEVYRFEGEGTKQEDFIVTKNGKECDTERFRQLYAFLLKVYGEELFMGEAPAEAPDVSVHVTTQNGREDYTVEFYRQSDLKTLVMRDNASFTIRTSCLEALLHNMEIFDDAGESLQMSWQ